MSEANKNQSLEFNILGCTVRTKADGQDNINATKAVELLNKEINSLRQKKPSLRDVDLAVLSALKLATGSLELEAEYKENVFALKNGIEDALNFVGEISAKESSASL